MPHPTTRAEAAYGAAVGGLLLGHWLTYLAASPRATNRLLAESGHAYLKPVNEVGVALAVAALALVFLGRLAGAGEGPNLRRLAVRIVTFQVTAFFAMEILERIMSGAPLSQLTHHGLLVTGTGIQIVVALAVTLLVRILVRDAELTAALVGRPAWWPTRPTIPLPTRRGGPRPPHAALGAFRGRAPPLFGS